MVNTIATVVFLAMWLAAAVADVWISSLASVRLCKALQRGGTTLVPTAVQSVLAWIGVFVLAWPVVGLWWAFRRLARHPVPDGHADG
jgi:hypothetical protein